MGDLLMKKTILSLAIMLLAGSARAAGVQININQVNGLTAALAPIGPLGVSTYTLSASTVSLNQVKASSGTNADIFNMKGVGYGVTASTNFVVTGAFVAKGTSTIMGMDPVSGFSEQLSSGIYTPNGTIVAGAFSGNGSALTNLPFVSLNGNNVMTGNNTFTGNVIYSTQVVTASFSAGSGFIFIACNAASGSVTFTLPTVLSSPGRMFNFKKTDSTSNTCILHGNGSENIDGANTVTIGRQYGSVSIWSGGTGDEWHVY